MFFNCDHKCRFPLFLRVFSRMYWDLLIIITRDIMKKSSQSHWMREMLYKFIIFFNEHLLFLTLTTLANWLLNYKEKKNLWKFYMIAFLCCSSSPMIALWEINTYYPFLCKRWQKLHYVLITSLLCYHQCHQLAQWPQALLWIFIIRAVFFSPCPLTVCRLEPAENHYWTSFIQFIVLNVLSLWQ